MTCHIKTGTVFSPSRVIKEPSKATKKWKLQCDCGTLFFRASTTLSKAFREGKPIMCSLCLTKRKEASSVTYREKWICMQDRGNFYYCLVPTSPRTRRFSVEISRSVRFKDLSSE